MVTVQEFHTLLARRAVRLQIGQLELELELSLAILSTHGGLELSESWLILLYVMLIVPSVGISSGSVHGIPCGICSLECSIKEDVIWLNQTTVAPVFNITGDSPQTRLFLSQMFSFYALLWRSFRGNRIILSFFQNPPQDHLPVFGHESRVILKQMLGEFTFSLFIARSAVSRLEAALRGALKKKLVPLLKCMWFEATSQALPEVKNLF